MLRLNSYAINFIRRAVHGRDEQANEKKTFNSRDYPVAG